MPMWRAVSCAKAAMIWPMCFQYAIRGWLAALAWSSTPAPVAFTCAPGHPISAIKSRSPRFAAFKPANNVALAPGHEARAEFHRLGKFATLHPVVERGAGKPGAGFDLGAA